MVYCLVQCVQTVVCVRACLCVYQPVRNLKAGSASEPIILILLKKGKVTPYVDLAKASMSRLVPVSVSPN